MALGLLAPATTVEAATTNKVAQFSINYVEDYTQTGTADNSTDVYIWGNGNGEENLVAYCADGYKVSFKLYIPASIMTGKTEIAISTWLNLNSVPEEEDGQYGGSVSGGPELIVRSDKKVMTWIPEQDYNLGEVSNATVKKTGDFYVVTISDYLLRYFNDEGAECDITQESRVNVDFSCSVSDRIMSKAVKNTVYIDDVKVATADGTELFREDFETSAQVEGNYFVGPDYEKDTPLSIATITDNKVLNVKSTKLSVKVGKTAKISAATPNSAKPTYTSSDKKVATVSSKGVVTGKKAGTATISVTANGKTVKVKVTVKK